MIMGSSLKLAVVSATVLSTAVMINLLIPLIMDASLQDVRGIWSSLISWLKPPYLYVVINCIIITIVASSRLQSKLDDFPPPSTFPTPPFEPAVKVEVPRFHQPQVPEVVPFDGVGLGNEQPVKENVAGYSSDRKVVQVPERDLSTYDFREEDMKTATEAYEEITKNMANKSVISMSSWTPSKISQVDLSVPMEKPPASTRFSRRKPTKATPEGGRTLGVAKPKRQDTLDTTWKTITEGRSVPLTRHLRKSDTWETHGRHHNNSTEAVERMTKSDTFDVNHGGGSCRKPPPPPSKLSRSGGSGRLKKVPSLGQEDLNRRVEAFIKKFNEDMRLQRQESLNQYMEMINRGAH
ncbi:uncharacterized protein LOC112506439 [Cynara cardunculus var. scolymus]|uniref:DUF4408 domain-containing protein n=1 Tax=Cynara cardunculus var. scolymus TaxID=59895 RepID=A0A103YJY0_CYNCS|nr:uncharacterized protein LOC112506439 [Cynara cardunculus var. scolymus]KVI10520.1 protein of unknown function DUF4408 [Cynara cardunculus var. scolymus]